MKAMNKTVEEYWLEYYVKDTHCSLCGNHGVIDTTGVKTAMGLAVGRLNWCICPNGQIMRKAMNGRLPQEAT